MMNLSAKCLVLSASTLAVPALAQEPGTGFDNFLLSSPSIVSPSQYYQVKGGRFEAVAGLLSGSFDTKPATSSRDLSGQVLGVGYAQALSSQLVLGADVNYETLKQDLNVGNAEMTETEIKPTVAFSLTPILSLGASIRIVSGKLEIPGASESHSYNNFTVGGTLHQDLWEGTLAFTTKNKSSDKTLANAPQLLSLHARYKVLPVLALGVRFDQADYPGVEAVNQSLETETSYGVMLESAFNEQSRVEVAFMSVGNEAGVDGDDATRIFIGGGFDLAPNFELGGQVQLDSGDGETEKYNINRFALTLTSRN